MNRRAFLSAATGGLLAAPLALEAQQNAQPGERSGAIVVGILGSEPAPEMERAIRAAVYPTRLHLVAATGSDAESLSAQARLLSGQRAAVIVAVGTPAAIAAAKATKGLPIVMVGVADPVALRLVRSLARPGGDMTGISLLGPELLEKSLDFLREAARAIRRPAVLWSSSDPGAALSLRQMQLAAAAQGLNFVSVPIEQAAHLDRLLTDLTQLHHDALMLIDDPVFLAGRDRILSYAAERRLPTVFSTASWVISGGLMSYEPQAFHLYRRAAAYVARILGGAKPTDLPVEQPTVFSFALNLKTANALGLTIPPSLALRADHLIE